MKWQKVQGGVARGVEVVGEDRNYLHFFRETIRIRMQANVMISTHMIVEIGLYVANTKHNSHNLCSG